MTCRHDPRKAQRHFVYDRKELRELFGVADRTVAYWIQRGLMPVDDHRPQLLAGSEVRRFLMLLRWPGGRQPENGKLFCPFCFKFQALRANEWQITPDELGRFNMRGPCTACGSMLQATVSRRLVNEVIHASCNIAGDSPDVSEGEVPGLVAGKGHPIPPETCKSNLRWLHHYRIHLVEADEREKGTVEEHLRSLARISALMDHLPFESYGIEDVRKVKNALRGIREIEERDGLSYSTVEHTLNNGRKFFEWPGERPGVSMDPHLTRYFNLSHLERQIAADAVKGTGLTFDQAITLFKAMQSENPIEVRNRAIVALLIVTGIRINALVTLLGKNVNIDTRWINQDPRDVHTKNRKHIRTYCLDLGHGLFEAIQAWSNWRQQNGFGDQDAFFLPDRHIQSNSAGLGYKPASDEPAECWKSQEPVRGDHQNSGRGRGIESGDHRFA